MKNEPAFPIFPDDGAPPSLGLTKFEYFAGQAMQGILANLEPNQTWSEVALAKDAVSQAKELIKQIEEGG